jgi:hypothetical protein
MTKRMVFDVESVGLHGEGFAVGWVVLDHLGNEVTCGLLSCLDRMASAGTQPDRAWVQENVIPHLPFPTHGGPFDLREAFWKVYKDEAPDELWADCPWPVEARFLNACIDQCRDARNWEGPYPLLDVGVMIRASGLDAMANHPRRPDEKPAHNPLNDARQSARLLLEAEYRLAVSASPRIPPAAEGGTP